MTDGRALTGHQVRAAALAAQGFGAHDRSYAPSTRAVLSTVRRIGLLQIDSINVLARAHYLPLFSRLGAYDAAALDRQSSRAPRRLFEYWGHEASLIPVETQPLLRWRMAAEHAWSGPRRVAREQPGLVAEVLAVVGERGPITAAALEELVAGDRVRTRDHWGWNWSDAKQALEYLFGCGAVSAAGRDASFGRRYDVIERVVPAEVLAAPTPSRSQAQQALVEQAARAQGVATAAHLRDYWRLSAADTAAAIEALLAEGTLEPVRVPDWPAAYRHRAAPIPRTPQGSGLLAPFDPLIWHRDRTEAIFGMRYRLEVYTPAARRQYGYYVLPYLHRGQLVARVDLKADRAAEQLQVRSAWAEPQVQPESYAADLRSELAAMARWLGLAEVSLAGARGDLVAPLGAR